MFTDAQLAVMLFVSRVYFDEVKRVGMALDTAESHLAAVEARLHPNGIDYAAIIGGGSLDMADLIAEKAMDEDEVAAQIGHWRNVMAEAERVAGKVSDPMASMALRFCYIDGMREDDAARKMHVARATVQRLKRNGLILAYPHVPEEWKRFAIPPAVLP